MRRPKVLPAAIAMALASVPPQTSARPTETRGNSVHASPESKPLLKIQNDGYHAIRSLTSGNFGDCVTEIKRIGATRLHLFRVGWVDPGQTVGDKQQTLLSHLCMQCPNLTGIKLSACEISLAEFESLFHRLRQLKSLSVESCRLIPAAVGGISYSKLAALPATIITNLSLRSSQGFNNANLARWLSAMPHLQLLELQLNYDAPFPHDALSLQAFKNLTYLSVDDNSQGLIGRVLANADQLKSLRLRSIPDTGADWKIPKTCSLQTLSLSMCEKLSGEKIDELLQSSAGLQDLTVIHCHDVTRHRLRISHLSQLRNLTFQGQRMSADSLAAGLSLLTQLESVTISGWVMKEADVRLDFSKHQKLKSLSLSSCSTTPELFAQIPTTVQQLKIGGCLLTDADVIRMLHRLVDLEELKLGSSFSPRGRDQPGVTGEGWSFAKQTKLKHIDFYFCLHITDDLIQRIATQIASLESLSLFRTDRLTGVGWDLGQSRLKHLKINTLKNLRDEGLSDLPTSLETLNIAECQQLTGRNWDLSRLTQMTEWSLHDCQSLTTLGSGLPPNLKELSVLDARKLACSRFPYSSMPRLATMTFVDCHKLDVDRLFVALPKFFPALENLTLDGCPDLKSSDWNLSSMRKSLRVVSYQEGDPSYFGGISGVGSRRLKSQLPNVQIHDNH